MSVYYLVATANPDIRLNTRPLIGLRSESELGVCSGQRQVESLNLKFLRAARTSSADQAWHNIFRSIAIRLLIDKDKRERST